VTVTLIEYTLEDDDLSENVKQELVLDLLGRKADGGIITSAWWDGCYLRASVVDEQGLPGRRTA